MATPLPGEDYLQDPDLWEDSLPQPYRMINSVLNELLERAWECIEQRAQLQHKEKSQIKLPNSDQGHIMCSEMLTSVQGGVCKGKEVVFVCSEKTLYVVKSVAEVVAKYEFQHQINGLSVASTSETVDIVFVQLETEIKVLAFLSNNFVEVAEFPHQSKDKMLGMTLASSCSHVAVAYYVSRPQSAEKKTSIATIEETKLALYSLPVSSWMAEMPSTIEELSEVSMASQSKEVTFSKPSLLYCLSPPPPLMPSTASPSSIFQSVSEQAGNIVPSGELHSLTKLYFENRQRMFTAKRRDFLPTDNTKQEATTVEPQLPTCHFLCYRLYHKLSYACEVAVWWQDSSLLTLYPLEEKSSSAIHPSRNFPQASPIVCSCVSEDSTMLALALRRGVVVLWDMKMDMFFRAVQCAQVPDVISALSFFKPPIVNRVMLAIGTNEGKVLIVDAMADSLAPVLPLNLKVKAQQQQQVCSDLFATSGLFNIHSKVVCFKFNAWLPSLLTAVHENGMFIVWNPVEQEPVCKLSLEPTFALASPPLCTFSNNGQHLLVAGEESESKACHVISFELSSISRLKDHWDVQRARSASGDQEQLDSHCYRAKMILLDAAEKHLKHYVTLRLNEMDENVMKWQENWKDLPNRLTKRKISC